MAIKTHSIKQDFVVLSPDKSATIEAADATLYQRLDRDYQDFKGHELISCHEFNEDWSSWEIHPNGDEVVILLSGDVTFVLQTEGGRESVQLKEQGSYVVVPKNVWHTALTQVETKLLFITPGEGTDHKSA